MAFRKSGKTAPKKAASLSKKPAKSSTSIKKRPKAVSAQIPLEGMNPIFNTVNDILLAAKPLIITWLQSYADKGKQSDKTIGDENVEELSKEEISKIGRKIAEDLNE